MKTRFDEVQSMSERVSTKSNLNTEVLHDTSIVIQRASEVLATAHKLQVRVKVHMMFAFTHYNSPLQLYCIYVLKSV
jgi:hypothetical protein